MTATTVRNKTIPASKVDNRLLQQLCAVHAPSGNESAITRFLLKYIQMKKSTWKVKPQVFSGAGLQDCIVLKFGKPRTAIFAHIDSTGFTVRYFNQLVPIGSPDAEAGALLVGEDSKGVIECELMFDHEQHALYKFKRVVDRGTTLTYKSIFKETKTTIQSPYLDNRLGVYAALKVAETLRDGIIVFSCWEEHGGGSVPYLARFIFDKWKVTQALVSDITWATDGVSPGKGVVISMRDRNIPRHSYVRRIIQLADKNKIGYQLEVEGIGSSDGRELQLSPYPFDWCFIGAPQLHPHTPHELVHKVDVESMIKLYGVLMKDL
jgi:putative aminopeptidase FrvX